MKPHHFAGSIGILLTLFLTACGGSDDKAKDTKTIEQAGKITYSENNFSIQIPEAWQIVNKNSFTSNVPPETIVGFKNNIKNEILTANVNVAAKELEDTTITVKDFAKGRLDILRNSLINFQILDEKETDDSYFVEFEGKKSAKQQIIHFEELFMVKNGIAYRVTAAYLPNEDESTITTLKAIIDSFTLK